MIGLFDVDGVLADLTPHTLASIGGRVLPEAIVTYDIHAYLNEDERSRMDELWSDAEWWRAIPVVPGAREAVDYARSYGYEVVAITAPWRECRGMESSRRAWLVEHFEIHGDATIFAPSRRKALVHGDLFVEDRLETIEAWVGRWGHMRPRAFLFDAPHNRVAKSSLLYARLEGWGGIYEHAL